MSLLVYIPGGVQKQRCPQLLHGVGLSMLLDDGCKIDYCDVIGNGPDGEAGLLLSVNHEGEPLHLDLEKQEWHKLTPDGSLPAGRAWIGWAKDFKPGPAQLQRRKQLPGEWMGLKDGNVWQIPIARQLPKLVGLDDEGKVSAVVEPAYAGFFRDSFAILQEFVQKNGEVVMDWERGFSFCVSALQINYRVSRDVVARLGLLEDHMFWTIPKAVTEAERIVELAQKKSPTGA